MVYGYSKSAHMVPIIGTASALEAPRVDDSNCVGSRSRDHKCILESFLKKVGTKLTFSMAFLFQTNGQTMHINGVLNQYLRNYVSVDQRDWANYVGLLEYSNNAVTHSMTKKLSFKAAYKMNSLQRANLAIRRVHSTVKFNRDGKDLVWTSFGEN
jgi:hypothetical protein